MTIDTKQPFWEDVLPLIIDYVPLESKSPAKFLSLRRCSKLFDLSIRRQLLPNYLSDYKILREVKTVSIWRLAVLSGKYLKKLDLTYRNTINASNLSEVGLKCINLQELIYQPQSLYRFKKRKINQEGQEDKYLFNREFSKSEMIWDYIDDYPQNLLKNELDALSFVPDFVSECIPSLRVLELKDVHMPHSNDGLVCFSSKNRLSKIVTKSFIQQQVEGKIRIISNELYIDSPSLIVEGKERDIESLYFKKIISLQHPSDYLYLSKDKKSLLDGSFFKKLLLTSQFSKLNSIYFFSQMMLCSHDYEEAFSKWDGNLKEFTLTGWELGAEYVKERLKFKCFRSLESFSMQHAERMCKDMVLAISEKLPNLKRLKLDYVPTFYASRLLSLLADDLKILPTLEELSVKFYHLEYTVNLEFDDVFFFSSKRPHLWLDISLENERLFRGNFMDNK